MKNSRKKKRIIFVGSIFLVSLVALFFVISNFRDNIVFFYAPSELRAEEVLKKTSNKQIRVGGLVKKNSVKKIDAATTEFVITDLQEDLAIRYVGLLPDLFREDQGVVAKGKFDVEKNEWYKAYIKVC